jgi:hypothetical protein
MEPHFRQEEGSDCCYRLLPTATNSLDQGSSLEKALWYSEYSVINTERRETKVSYRKRCLLTIQCKFVKKNAESGKWYCAVPVFTLGSDRWSDVHACVFVCECEGAKRGFWYIRNHDEVETYGKPSLFEIFGIHYFIFATPNFQYAYFTSKLFSLFSDEPSSELRHGAPQLNDRRYVNVLPVRDVTHIRRRYV